ncbi:MAG: hypothetical protein ACI89D_002105 [Bermanella sp.]
MKGEKGMKDAEATPAATPITPSTPDITDFIERRATRIFDSLRTRFTSFIAVSSRCNSVIFALGMSADAMIF